MSPDDDLPGDDSTEERVLPPLEDRETAPLGEGPRSSMGFFARGDSPSPRPERMGPYRILDTLGEGGMGVVYLAEQEKPVRRRVALKVIKHGMDTREVVARFEHERQTLARMSHSSIARIHDAGTGESGQPYFAMEYVEGVPIHEACREMGLDLPRRLELFARVCDAVQHAHQRGIIHRDLKPTNVLVTEEDGKPLPKIIDFGIARLLEPDPTAAPLQTSEGSIIGTLEYMSPEQADPARGELDTRSDVYALGVILYELIADTLPFDTHELRSGSWSRAIRIICDREPPRPSLKAPDTREARVLRGELDWIVLKALRKAPDERYRSPSDLAEDLARYLRHEPVLAGPPGPLYRLKKFVLRHRGAVITSAALLGLASMGLVTYQTLEAQEYRKILGEFFAAVENEDVSTARELLTLLEDRRPGSGDVRELGFRLQALRFIIAEREARDILEEARASLERFRRLGEERSTVVAAIEETLNRQSLGLREWIPAWEREEELGRLPRRRRIERAMQAEFNGASRSLELALETVPESSPVRRQILETQETLAFLFWKQAVREDEVRLDPEFFTSQIEGLGLGTYRDEIGGRGRIQLEITPAESEVHVFRYQELEGHLLPLPIDVSGGVVPEGAEALLGPVLRLERNYTPERTPFRAGDEFISVNGQPVSRRGDLAAALNSTAEGDSVPVELLRDGQKLTVEWIPFADGKRWGDEPEDPDRLIEIRDQLGLVFEGYPLRRHPRSRLEPTGDAGPGDLEVDLPAGSYLLVARHPGYLEARVPVSIPRDSRADPARELRLVEETRAPEDFVHIPGGSFESGGDPDAYRGLLPARRVEVKDFLMKRHEVTFDEYLEFLNDPETIAIIDTDDANYPTRVEDLKADWSSSELTGIIAPVRGQPLKFYLVPFNGLRGKFFFRFEASSGKWEYNQNAHPSFPVEGLSLVAAREYAAWRSRRSEGRFRFRLPRGDEWEQAARGNDRRHHVWGEALVPPHCQSDSGFWRLSSRYKTSVIVGSSPLDVSVHGVHDLAGSVSEPTLDLVHPGSRYFIYRGGNRTTADIRDFRIASRNSRRGHRVLQFLGIRLVCDLERS